MKTFVTIIFLSITNSLFAQYNNPYRVTFDGKNHFITNKGNGTVSRLDSAFKHTSIISGLYSPNDIFFGSFVGNSALIVIDSNTIKLFDPSTYNSFINIPITNAVEAHDGVNNPLNSNEFFISDRAGDKIIKGTIGPAPLYLISFSTLTADVQNPAGMIFNKKGKLVVVSDTTNSQVYEIDVSSGNVDTVLSSSFDNFNDVAQDNEGNYYFTCWGNNNLYRYDSLYKSPTVISTFNNPSGLYSNLNSDYLVLACYNCQKVEFLYYHLFSPLSDITTCPNDSFYVDFTPTYKGIGTYNSNNTFLVELSDSNGNFSAPTVIGSVKDSIRPSTIQSIIKSGSYANSGYKYRIRSTSPEHKSYFEKSITILPQPNSNIHDGDTAYACLGVNRSFSIEHKSSQVYSWLPDTGITEVSPGEYSFTLVSNEAEYPYAFYVRDTVTGCTSSDDLIIKVKSSAELSNFKDSIAMCLGDTIAIGGDKLPYIYNWDNTQVLNSNSLPNPLFFGKNSTLVTLNYSDSSKTCFGEDSVYIEVVELNIRNTISDSIKICNGSSVKLGIDSGNYQYSWTGGNGLSDYSVSNPTFNGTTSNTFYVFLSDSTFVCSDIDTVYVEVIPLPVATNWLDSINLCFKDTIKIGTSSSNHYIYRWDTSSLISNDSISDPLFYGNKEGKTFLNLSITDTITSCLSTIKATINVYPKMPKPEIIEGLGFLYLATDYGGTYKWSYYDYNLQKDTFIITDTNALDRTSFHFTNQIFVIVTDSNGCEHYSDPYNLIIEGVEEHEVSILIRPNPSNGRILIQSDATMTNLRLININGMLVEDYQVRSKLSVDYTFKDIPAGLYFLEIDTELGTIRKRIILN